MYNRCTCFQFLIFQSNMEDQGVTSKLQQKVLRYYEYLWARNRGLKIKDLLADAPFCLQCEIYLSITFEMLQSVSFH